MRISILNEYENLQTEQLIVEFVKFILMKIWRLNCITLVLIHSWSNC